MIILNEYFVLRRMVETPPNPNVIFSLSLGTGDPNTTPSEQSHAVYQNKTTYMEKIKEDKKILNSKTINVKKKKKYRSKVK
jgi:hypothetical protein